MDKFENRTEILRMMDKQIVVNARMECIAKLKATTASGDGSKALPARDTNPLKQNCIWCGAKHGEKCHDIYGKQYQKQYHVARITGNCYRYNELASLPAEQ